MNCLVLQAAPKFTLLSLTRLRMSANGAGGATSKPSPKAARTAPPMPDTESKVKPAQQSREPAEVAMMSNEDASPSGALKARGAAVHNAEWAPHEQAALDQAAVKYPAERYQPFERYVRIAATLPRKGVRDVALRLRWLSQARKRKVSDEGPNSKRLRRDRCQSIFASQQKPANGMGQWPQQQLPMPQLDDHGAQTVGAVGGLVAQLLEANLHILYQYKQNMHQFKVQENTELLVRFRDNILAVLNQMNSMDGVMSQMPQLPVRMNVELANNFLPAASGASPMFPLGMPGMPPGMGHVAPGPMPMNGGMVNMAGAMPSMPMASNSMPASSVVYSGPQQQQQQQHSNGMHHSPGEFCCQHPFCASHWTRQRCDAVPWTRWLLVGCNHAVSAMSFQHAHWCSATSMWRSVGCSRLTVIWSNADDHFLVQPGSNSTWHTVAAQLDCMLQQHHCNLHCTPLDDPLHSALCFSAKGDPLCRASQSRAPTSQHSCSHSLPCPKQSAGTECQQQQGCNKVWSKADRDAAWFGSQHS